MKLHNILTQCCLFCDGFDSETNMCGTRKVITNPLSYSCSFCTVSNKFETFTEVEDAIEKCYGKSWKDVDPWKDRALIPKVPQENEEPCRGCDAKGWVRNLEQIATTCPFCKGEGCVPKGMKYSL